ncbi:hypothetical protein M3M33_05330 [Loigolactobacillus coryniformis]|uniref:DUF6711 family protein n=1 Tax=Loigolactobacillus coryniformis TaxID=1610 RepID=UPI00201A921E|nr:DUF6711 family protein [Loigolactobacillus coryniformis]MCL5458095.1 hypothetical protein [Loigolactobacillus coryniformis]
MQLSAVLTINGVAVKAPKSFSAIVQDIDGNSTRDASGNMHRDRITVKRKLTIAWGPLSNNEIAVIMQAISGVFFGVTYPDPQTGTQKTATFYVGDRTAAAYSWNNKFAAMMWQNLSFDLVEQ